MTNTTEALIGKLCVTHMALVTQPLADRVAAGAKATAFEEAKAAVVAAIDTPFEYATKKIGDVRAIVIDGKIYSYGRTAGARDGDDQYHFTVPGDERFSHPTLEGCLLGILKHASGAVFDRDRCETHNRGSGK